MKRFALVLSLAAVLGLSNAVSGQQEVWVYVQSEAGHDVMGFLVRDRPYTAGMTPAVGERLTTTARDRKGRSIDEFGFYGWADGKRTLVILLGRGPADKAGYQELARYSLALGETRTVDALKDFGLQPMTLRVETR